MLTESFDPHLIILDYMLPDVNGDVVCQRVRDREGEADTKVIFVSGVVESVEVERLLEAGAEDFVRKPFDIEKLIARIGELLGV